MVWAPAAKAVRDLCPAAPAEKGYPGFWKAPQALFRVVYRVVAGILPGSRMVVYPEVVEEQGFRLVFFSGS